MANSINFIFNHNCNHHFLSQIIKVGREYVYKKIKSDSDISSNYYDEENCENLFQEKQVSTKNKAPDSFSELHRGFWDIIKEEIIILV